MKPISYFVKDLISPLLNKSNVHITRLIFNWPQIVGDDIAKFSYPLKIKNNQNGDALHVATLNSAAGAELHYLKAEIIDKITAFTGDRTIVDLKFELKLQKQDEFCVEVEDGSSEDHLAIAADCEELSIIKDLDLKENLAKLFNNIKKS